MKTVTIQVTDQDFADLQQRIADAKRGAKINLLGTLLVGVKAVLLEDGEWRPIVEDHL